MICKNDIIIQRVVIYEQILFVINRISWGVFVVRIKNKYQNYYDKSYLNGCFKVK